MSTVVATVNFGTETVELPPTAVTHLEAAPVYDVYKLEDDRTKTLRKLLEKGHVTVAPLRNPQLILHSHLPHVSSRWNARVCDLERSGLMYGSC